MSNGRAAGTYLLQRSNEVLGTKAVDLGEELPVLLQRILHLHLPVYVDEREERERGIIITTIIIIGTASSRERARVA